MEVSRGQCRQIRPHPLRARARSVPRVLPGVPGAAGRSVPRPVGKGEDRRPGVWTEAGKQGFLGMAVPEEYGGGGNEDFRYNAIVTEETAAGRYSGIGFSLHNDVVAPYLIGWPTRSRSSAGCRVLYRRNHHRDRDDRARHRQRPAGHQDPRGPRGRPLGPQRLQDVHHQRHPRRPGGRRRPDRSGQGRPGLLAARRRARHERLRARSQPRQVGLEAQDTAELSFTESGYPPRNCSARRARGSST